MASYIVGNQLATMPETSVDLHGVVIVHIKYKFETEEFAIQAYENQCNDQQCSVPINAATWSVT